MIFRRADNSQGKEDYMTRKYEAPKLIEIFDATKCIQGSKDGPNGDAHLGPMQPETIPAYPADE